MVSRLLAAGAALAVLVPFTGAHAGKFETVYAFCSQQNCTDGNSPLAGLLRDASGNLYGTTEVGGAYGNGVVFELVPKGKGWSYKVLHDFCYSCGDGTNPVAGLIIDVNGNLYGTTAQSGPTGCGTAFELSPKADGSKWTEMTIYAASCAPFGNNVDTGLTYQGAATGAPYDGVSPLYGTTNSGGTGAGTVYMLMPKGGKWKETDLYAFCPNGTDGCNDGRFPGTLTLDANGRLFGLTFLGGAADAGTIYVLKPNARKPKWGEKMLYSFCSRSNCTDGGYPSGALAMDGAGNIFGTTTTADSESGTVYELAQDSKGWRETVLYTFCSEQNCADGYLPDGGVIRDAAGNPYGTTSIGGTGGAGTVFELSGSKLKTLHAFCSSNGCADGSAPLAPLMMDSSGRLYGTTSQGGDTNNGTVFALKAR